MAKIIPLKPEYAYPELMYDTLREQKMAMRVRMRLQEAYPEIKFSVEVRAKGDERPIIFVYLKDFQHQIFNDSPTEEEFNAIKLKWNFVDYLTDEFRQFRDSVHNIAMRCFAQKDPEIRVEVVGSVIQRSIKY